MKKKSVYLYEAGALVAALMLLFGVLFGASNAEHIGKNKGKEASVGIGHASH